MVAAGRTVHSGARCPRPTVPRCASSRAPRASFGAWFVCAGVLVTVTRAGWAGGALCWTLARVLAINIDAGSVQSAPRTSCTIAPHSTQRTPRIACDRHQHQQWCAGEGGGAAVLADGGVVKGRHTLRSVCACKHTPIFSVPQQVQHRSHSTKQLLPMELTQTEQYQPQAVH